MNQQIQPAPATTVPLWRKLAWIMFYAILGAWCLKALSHDLAQLSLDFLAERWDLALAACVLSLVNYVLRIVRWQLYLRRAGQSFSWPFVALTYMAGFAFTLSPGKLGEVVRARYYVRRGTPLSVVTGAFFVERLLDLTAMIVLATLALAEFPDYRSFFWVAVAAVSGLLAMVIFLPWQQLAAKLAQLGAQGRLAQAFRGVANMLSNARSFLPPSLLLVGFFLGLLAWGAEAYGLKLIADAVHPQGLPVFSAMGIYAIAIIVGALSFLPGGLGSTEAVMTALLLSHHYTMPQAIMITLICRLLTLWLAVALGWGSVWLLRKE